MIAALVTGSIINATCVVETEPELVLNRTGEILVSIFDYIGTIFMNLLKMVIVPLVFSSLLVGVASLGDVRKLGRLGVRTIGLGLFCRKRNLP